MCIGLYRYVQTNLLVSLSSSGLSSGSIEWSLFINTAPPPNDFFPPEVLNLNVSPPALNKSELDGILTIGDFYGRANDDGTQILFI